MRTKARVLVMGATGQVGGALVPLLAREGHIEVVAAARAPGKAEQFGVPIVHLDLDKIETFAPALEGVDRIFMATGLHHRYAPSEQGSREYRQKGWCTTDRPPRGVRR